MTILVTGTIAAGGLDAVLENARSIDGFLDFFGIATPAVDAAGVQQVANGAPVFGEAGQYGLLTVISTLSWGLGYFGVPQVLLRFMAIRKEEELTKIPSNRYDMGGYLFNCRGVYWVDWTCPVPG